MTATTIVTAGVSITMDYEYQYGYPDGFGPYGLKVVALSAENPAEPTIGINGTLDVSYSGSTPIGISDVAVTISGGGLPTEVMTVGSIDGTFNYNGVDYVEFDLSDPNAAQGTGEVYSHLYIDVPTTLGGVEESYNGGEPFTHLTTVYASNYDSSADPAGSITSLSSSTPITACFVAGTNVRTPAGDVAIESLKIGDLVSLSDGRQAPVTWVGIKTVATRFADALRMLPVRIKAGALADNLPARDMLVSPDHAILVNDMLVQAGALVNGVSIFRERNMPAMFTYYHVELADHSLIIVEGVAAETFVDNVDRMAFDNWAEHQELYGETTGIVEMAYPRVKSARQLPPAVRDALLARGNAMFAAAA
jgi:hypothetical protein